MAGALSGIEIARRAIQAQQTALTVAGHNIANANTPGYSRQMAVMQTTSPLPSGGGPGQEGTGVTIREIKRIRDSFIDARIQNELQKGGRWKSRAEILEQIELLFNEPSDFGIRASLDGFWRAMQDLSVSPNNDAVRATVTERAKGLCESIRHTRWSLVSYTKDINSSIRVDVGEVNALGARIAELNNQISISKNLGEQPNDLLDRRNLLIEELAELINIDIVSRDQDTVAVYVGGIALVDGLENREMNIIGGNSDDEFVIRWGHTGIDVNITGGRLKGLIELRDNDLAHYLQSLDAIAATLIDRTNQVHRSGYGLDGNTDRDFFTGTGADDISVAQPVVNNLALIAASASGEAGDGENAMRMAQVQHELLMLGGTATIGGFYNATITELGVAARKAMQASDNEEVLIGHLKNLQESVAGVSLDEEMANMIRFQHAYNAAARFLTAMDENLDRIINHTGLSGMT